jgi:hypothetical protein
MMIHAVILIDDDFILCTYYTVRTVGSLGIAWDNEADEALLVAAAAQAIAGAVFIATK